MSINSYPPEDVLQLLRRGTVIPAQPLALTAERRLDERRQAALPRYYLASGCGGLAVGVHTTQFEIRDPKVGLYGPVLDMAASVIDAEAGGRPFIRIAGVCGPTGQAVAEASLAADKGYHAVLLSLAALRHAGDEELLHHCRQVSQVLPLIGFYLQPSVGGRVLGYPFWRGFAEIERVLAIKMAPFNRYRTLDVIRAVADAGRTDIALYTGNDDNIISDLLTPFNFGGRQYRIVGGLLGHWAVWTRRAVELLKEIHFLTESGQAVPQEMLARAAAITDCNAAFFDAANDFAGCIAGIHEVLRRQGLLAGRWCLNPAEELSSGQMEEIDRVYRAYPHLNDDDFVAAHLNEWLGQ